MKKTLNVPYKSQWDTDAYKTNNDCGPTSCAMVLNFYGGSYTTNQVFEETGAGTGFITAIQLRKAMYTLGYVMNLTSGRKIADLKASIDRGIPVMVVLHYGYLTDNQDSFTGAHILVVVGYDDNGIYFNDPDFYSSRREEGKQRYNKNADFDRAWQSTIDGNLAGNFWTINPPNGVLNTPIINDNNNSIDLDTDIPTEIEDKFSLKEVKRYDKHWSFKDLILDWVDMTTEIDKLKSKLDKTESDYEVNLNLFSGKVDARDITIKDMSRAFEQKEKEWNIEREGYSDKEKDYIRDLAELEQDSGDLKEALKGNGWKLITLGINNLFEQNKENINRFFERIFNKFKEYFKQLRGGDKE